MAWNFAEGIVTTPGTFLLLAIGGETAGIYTGFRYCIAVGIPGQLADGTSIEKLVDALTVLGPTRLLEGAEIEVQGQRLQVQALPDLSDFLERLGLSQRSEAGAGGVRFGGPVGRTGVLKDVYSDDDVKVTYGFDIARPDDLQVRVFRRATTAGPVRVATLLAKQDTFAKIAPVQRGLLGDQDLCMIQRGTRLATAEMDPAEDLGDGQHLKVRVMDEPPCERLAESFFVFKDHFELE